MMELHDVTPGLDHLVGVAGADDGHAGDRPQRRELLDRLVGRAVFADADRVVREDVDDRDFHQGRQADRHPAVVAEDQEAGAEGRTLTRAMPFMMAPMACSRTPKWKLRPP